MYSGTIADASLPIITPTQDPGIASNMAPKTTPIALPGQIQSSIPTETAAGGTENLKQSSTMKKPEEQQLKEQSSTLQGTNKLATLNSELQSTQMPPPSAPISPTKTGAALATQICRLWIVAGLYGALIPYI